MMEMGVHYHCPGPAAPSSICIPAAHPQREFLVMLWDSPQRHGALK